MNAHMYLHSECCLKCHIHDALISLNPSPALAIFPRRLHADKRKEKIKSNVDRSDLLARILKLHAIPASV